jgi:hypothetical protein
MVVMWWLIVRCPYLLHTSPSLEIFFHAVCRVQSQRRNASSAHSVEQATSRYHLSTALIASYKDGLIMYQAGQV